jgi:hypothetical protein
MFAFFINTFARDLKVTAVSVTRTHQGLVIRECFELGRLANLLANDNTQIFNAPVIIPACGYKAKSSEGFVDVITRNDTLSTYVSGYKGLKTGLRAVNPYKVYVLLENSTCTIKKVYTNSNTDCLRAALKGLEFYVKTTNRSLFISAGQSDSLDGIYEFSIEQFDQITLAGYNIIVRQIEIEHTAYDPDNKVFALENIFIKYFIGTYNLRKLKYEVFTKDKGKLYWNFLAVKTVKFINEVYLKAKNFLDDERMFGYGAFIPDWYISSFNINKNSEEFLDYGVVHHFMNELFKTIKFIFDQDTFGYSIQVDNLFDRKDDYVFHSEYVDYPILTFAEIFTFHPTIQNLVFTGLGINPEDKSACSTMHLLETKYSRYDRFSDSITMREFHLVDVQDTIMYLTQLIAKGLHRPLGYNWYNILENYICNKEAIPYENRNINTVYEILYNQYELDGKLADIDITTISTNPDQD